MQYSYLALGDSYTIGEAVLLSENFPYQTVSLLRKTNPDDIFYAPEIVAKTGWTTDELNAAIQQTTFLKTYDIVSLLIGVNNQYRGREVENFKIEFEDLLQKAIKFAGGKNENVFVLSIPDWSVTPFAEGKDIKKIAEEIDTYNAVCESISAKYEVNFIDITTSQRNDSALPGMIADDKLHPGKNEYAKWANAVVQKVLRATTDDRPPTTAG